MNEEVAREFLRRLNALEKEFGLRVDDWRVSQDAPPWWSAQATIRDGERMLLADEPPQNGIA